MFNHKHGCQKCLSIGTFCNEFHRMSFPDLHAVLRSNDSFRNRTHPIHHKTKSPFEDLDIDMVLSFPTSDPLHLLELGVLRKCIYRWVNGEPPYKGKWSKALVSLTSRLLAKVQCEMPSDIHRAVRTLDSLRHWKGLEYRTMILYVGCVIFKQVLPDHEYNHFLLLFTAVRICSCNIYTKYYSLASKMFEMYVEQYKLIYGYHTIGSNVHNLIHIVQDLINCNANNLINISTYKFENALRLLGLKLKHTNRPLEQVVCRLIEQNHHKSNFQNRIEPTEFKPKVFYGLKLENVEVYKKIEIAPNLFFSSKKSNNSWFLTKKKEIVKFEYAGRRNFKLYGKVVQEKRPFFNNPITSTKLDIYASDIQLENNVKGFNVESIAAKMICLSYQNEFVFIPLLHSLEILNK